MYDLPDDLEPYAARLGEWITTYHYGHFIKTAQELPLRRDMITVLAYVHDNKIVGTQTAGNMPLKHIRAVTSHFVEPPVLDTKIGDRVYKLRTEFDVWPLFFLHVLAEAADLLTTPQGARWLLTEAGERYLEGDPLLQVLSLFSVWWYRIDWRIALRYETGELPDGFPTAALALLLSHAPNQWINLADFARTLNKRTGITQTLHSDQYSDMLVRNVRYMVVKQLIEFGVAEAQPGKPVIGTNKFRTIENFKLTWFGKAMLEGLNL